MKNWISFICSLSLSFPLPWTRTLRLRNTTLKKRRVAWTNLAKRLSRTFWTLPYFISIVIINRVNLFIKMWYLTVIFPESRDQIMRTRFRKSVCYGLKTHSPVLQKTKFLWIIFFKVSIFYLFNRLQLVYNFTEYKGRVLVFVHYFVYIISYCDNVTFTEGVLWTLHVNVRLIVTLPILNIIDWSYCKKF